MCLLGSSMCEISKDFAGGKLVFADDAVRIFKTLWLIATWVKLFLSVMSQEMWDRRKWRKRE